MILGEKLINYYKLSSLDKGEKAENDEETDQVTYFYVGPYLVPFPNNSTLSKAIHYHNLHRLLLGYADGRMGEGETGAWELGTFCWNRPATLFSSWGALVVGLLLSPRRMAKAFLRGCKSRNIYRHQLNDLLAREEEDIKNYMLNTRRKGQYVLINVIRMSFYFSIVTASMPIVLTVNWLIATARSFHH